MSFTLHYYLLLCITHLVYTPVVSSLMICYTMPRQTLIVCPTLLQCDHLLITNVPYHTVQTIGSGRFGSSNLPKFYPPTIIILADFSFAKQPICQCLFCHNVFWPATCHKALCYTVLK